MFKYLILPFLLLIIGCNKRKYFQEEIEIIASDDLFECETENFHWRIDSVLHDDSGRVEKGELIYPVIGKDTLGYNKILFPIKPNKEKIFLRGYYSKAVHNDYSAGCIGTHYFKIIYLKKMN